MKTYLPCIAFFVSVLAFNAALVGQEEKSIRKATIDDYKKIVVMTEFMPKFTGKLSGLSPKSVSFHIDDSQYQAAKKAAEAMPNGAQKNLKLRQIEAAFGNYKFILGKDVEFEFTEKVVLRKMNLLFEYDEKGFPKKYTPAELTKLKGDATKPGYQAKAEDFSPGSMATVHLIRSKDNKPMATMVIVNNK